MNAEHPTTIRLERYAWTAVKASFVVLVLSLVLNPASKGRTGLAGGGLETVLPAQIRAAGLHSVNARMSGRLAQLAVKAGDTVAAGQLLAVIENPEIEGLLERARRRVALARQSATTPGRAGAAGTSGSAQQKWLDEQHSAAVRNLRAAEQRLREFSLADSERAAARARSNAERIRALLDQRLATAREAEDAQRESDNEQRNLASRRDTLGRLKQDLEAAQSQVRMARLQLESAASAPAAQPGGYAQLELEEAEAAYQSLAARADALRITAPASGTIIRIDGESGGPVQEGAVLLQIADSGNLHFDVSAPASVARAVKPGDPVLVRVPADPPVEVPARVAQVLLEPDPQQRSYLIRVTIPNPAPDRLLVGLEGAVSFNH